MNEAISSVVKFLNVSIGLDYWQRVELKVLRGSGNTGATALVLLCRKLKLLKMVMTGRVEEHC